MCLTYDLAAVLHLMEQRLDVLANEGVLRPQRLFTHHAVLAGKEEKHAPPVGERRRIRGLQEHRSQRNGCRRRHRWRRKNAQTSLSVGMKATARPSLPSPVESLKG